MKPRLPLELRIAWRYLFSKKRHAAVNLISSPVEIQASDSRFFKADSLLDAINAIPETGMVMPLLKSKAYADAEEGQMAVEILGTEPEWITLSGAANTIIDGTPIVADTLGATLGTISVGTAMQIGVRPADHLRLIVPRNRDRLNPGNIMGNFRTDSIIVAGVTRTGEDKLDASLVVVPISHLRRLLSADSSAASHIAIYPADRNVSERQLLSAVRNVLPDGFNALTIAQQNSESFKMIAIEKWVTFVLLAFILIVASFNILSTLVMLMIEKQSNMRVLRSMGLSERNIRNIFIWEGVLVSGAGCMAGAIAGILLVGCQMQWGWVKLSAAGIDPALLSISTYPVALSFEDLIAVLALASVTSFLASFVAVIVGRKKF